MLFHVSEESGIARFEPRVPEGGGAAVVWVRVLANLWGLRDAVVASTLQFSVIRMRNALPRVEG